MGLLAEGAGAAGADEGGAGWVHCCGEVRLKVEKCMDGLDGLGDEVGLEVR